MSGMFAKTEPSSGGIEFVKSILFKEENPGTVAFLRIGVGIVFFFDAIIRWPYVVELYTSDGLPMPLFPEKMLEIWSIDAITGVLLYSFLLFGLICIAIGWKTRWSLCVVFVLSCWFGLLDSAGTFKKYSVIELHLLFLLFFSNCHLRWSVDAMLKKSNRQGNFLSPVWPRVLIQVLISSIYLQSVITKIRLADFTTGDVILFNMLDDRWGGTWLGMWVATKPFLLVSVSWGTLFVEMTAGLLLWFRAARIPMLVVAYFFHIGIWMTMHIGIFSPVMLVLLIAFVGEDDWRKIKALFAKVLPVKARNVLSVLGSKLCEKFASWRNVVLSRNEAKNEGDLYLAKKLAKEWAYYLFAACVFVVAGYQYQQYFDRYHVFGEEAESKWIYLRKDFIDEITERQNVASADYVFLVETGDIVGYRHVFGKKKKYPLNSSMYTLVRFSGNHPALVLEYIVRSKSDKEAAKGLYLKQVEVDANLAIQELGFLFTKKENPPGDYIFILQVEGEEVYREYFEIVSNEYP